LFQKKLKKLIVDFLNEKIRNYFILKIKKDFQHVIEDNLKLMEENLEEFNLNLPLLIEDLLNSEITIIPFSIRTLILLKKIDITFLNFILKAFYELIFTAINNKEPEQEKKEEEKTSEEIVDQEKKTKPVPTQEDLDILKAKGKIKLVYEAISEEDEKFHCITKCCVPLNYNHSKVIYK
jgi:hypothetical protein